MLKIRDIFFEAEDNSGKTPILKGISADFNKNKLYAVTGPNGAGKSTLLKIIMGLYPPSSGRVFLADEDITDLSVTEKAEKGICYGFQTPPRFKGFTVKKLLEISGRNNPDNNPAQVLMSVGLCTQDYLEREIDDSLSGGEMKRIEIASVLARSPEVALFDEPEAGIDLWSFQKMAETLGSLRDRGTTVIVVSHQERILELADEIFVINEGLMAKADKETLIQSFDQSCCEYFDYCQKGVGLNVKQA